MAESFVTHPDLSSSTISMTALPTGTDDIISDSTIGIFSTSTLSSPVSPSPAYVHTTVTYSISLPSSSEVYYQTADQSISVIEIYQTTSSPSIPCSSQGTTSISYSIGNYVNGNAPSWVSIDSTSGVLNMTAPEVSQDTEYDFYINSAMTVNSNNVQIPKLIKLKVINCSVQNCQR